MQLSLEVGFKPLDSTFKVYGVPYMGNKMGIARDIFNFISERHEVGTLVEPFCGGFSIGSTFLRNGWEVIANDYNKYTYALLKKTIFEGLPDGIEQEWISREKYNDIKTNPEKYEDWYVGYIGQCWSFGTQGIQGAYLFGKDREELKRLGQLTVTAPTSTERRLYLKQITRYIQKETTQKEKDRVARDGAEIQQLQQLERLERLQQLELHSLDYKDIEVPDGAVVYCDPPYQDTAKYHKDVDHDEFWEWVRELSKTNPVYVSSYKAPEDFMSVWNKRKVVTLSSNNNSNYAQEHLFIYEEA